VELSEADFKQRLVEAGVADWIAGYLAQLDLEVADGKGSEVTGNVLQIVGRPGRTLEDFVEENKKAWM
jgi:hypothetical protein